MKIRKRTAYSSLTPPSRVGVRVRGSGVLECVLECVRVRVRVGVRVWVWVRVWVRVRVRVRASGALLTTPEVQRSFPNPNPSALL